MFMQAKENMGHYCRVNEKTVKFFTALQNKYSIIFLFVK